jgi:hypothetical protein
MPLNGNMATEVAKGAFLPALKYGASSPTRCDFGGSLGVIASRRQIVIYTTESISLNCSALPFCLDSTTTILLC